MLGPAFAIEAQKVGDALDVRQQPPVGLDVRLGVGGYTGDLADTTNAGPLLGIVFSDQLLHGWDLAKATGQDATMPAGLARASYDFIHGRFTDAQRTGVFKPEVTVGNDASAQDKLLAYTGRDPAR